jgi:serine/threonine protein kinase
MAGAMCYLHAAGILHGDLTGNNILLSGSEKDGRGFTAKVADFGLSRVLDGREAIQTTSYGTVTHMPPELLLEGKMTKAGDVYAYGVILWEMFMGQRPWSGLSHGQIIQAITTSKQLALGSSCPTILRKLIYRCMAAKAEERPSFEQLIVELDEVEDELVGTS